MKDLVNNKIELRGLSEYTLALLDSPENSYLCFLNEAGVKNLKNSEKLIFHYFQNSHIIIKNGEVIKNFYGPITENK